ncbi:MAG: pitrilysin family protein [bacterium]
MKRNKWLVVAITLALITVMRVGIMAQDDILKVKLDNGLTVIIKENHAAPVVAVNFWIKTGAAFENDCEKGISHFIEHMLFKGTTKRKVGDIDKEIKSLGGYNNAFTSYDATNYIIVLPGDQVGKALEIEYDALTSSVFDESELNKEREVILAELYRGLDNPDVFMWQKFMNLSFDNYYKDPIIGYAPLLKDYTRKQIYDYYKKYYTVDNMIIVVSGDVDKNKVLATIKKSFGTLKPAVRTKKQTTPVLWNAVKNEIRYKTLSGKIEARYLAIGFKIPDALSTDIPKLDILAKVLGGSESSPLYRVLKEEKQLVDFIDCDIFSGKFGGLFVISANVREGKYAQVVKEIFVQLDKLKVDGIKVEDIARVKSDIARQESKEDMQVESAALNLGHYELLGDYNLYYKYNDTVKRVLDKDLKEVMDKYLQSDSTNIVIYYPEKNEAEFEKYKSVKDILEFVKYASPVKTSEEGVVTKTILPNGITLIHKKLTNAGIVDMKFYFRGGIVFEGVEDGYYEGITNLMLSTMLKGTKAMSYTELARKIDDLGAILSPEIKKDSFGWAAEVVPANLDEFMNILADININPSFPADEVKKEKEDVLNRIKEIKDSPPEYLYKLFNKLFFDWHPYGYPVIGEADSVKRITAAKLKDWHDKYIAANNMIISVVGNVDADYMKALINEKFAKLKTGKASVAKLPVKISTDKKIEREIIDKNQSHILIGFLGPKTNSDDYFPMKVLDNILSGGMDSRLFREVREKRNLCYTVYSSFDRYVEKGAFKIYTATAPENEQKAVDEIFKVLVDLRDNGITDQELKSTKSYMSGMFKVGLQDYMSQAEVYLSYELWGMGYQTADEYITKINNVTKEEVNAVAKKYIKLNNYTQVIVGPAEKEAKTNDKNTESK